MDERTVAETGRRRARCFAGAVGLAVAGLGAMGVGFAAGGTEGEAATAWGVVAGVGFALVLVGVAAAWRMRPGDKRWMTESRQTKRDRLQAQRSRQLFLLPAVALIFLALAFGPTHDVATGQGEYRDYLAILLPVLYAWVSAAIAMGWDRHSRANRTFLEDELTGVLRARAMTSAFVVLMSGATAALGLGLIRPDLGAMALVAALAAAGATAGVRFAWLDREAGRDG